MAGTLRLVPRHLKPGGLYKMWKKGRLSISSIEVLFFSERKEEAEGTGGISFACSFFVSHFANYCSSNSNITCQRKFKAAIRTLDQYKHNRLVWNLFTFYLLGRYKKKKRMSNDIVLNAMQNSPMFIINYKNVSPNKRLPNNYQINILIYF